jgi:hypothetical protein
MALSGLHDQQAATVGSGLAGQRIVEVPVPEALDYKFFDEIERGPCRLRVATGCFGMGVVFKHLWSSPDVLGGNNDASRPSLP